MPEPDFSTDNLLSRIPRDPYALYRQLRGRGRPAPMAIGPHHTVYGLASYKDVHEVLSSANRFENVHAALNDTPEIAPLISGLMLCTPDGQHTHAQRVLSNALSPIVLEREYDWIRGRANNALTRASADGPFDAVTHLARPYVADTILELAGFPPGDRMPLMAMTEAAFNALAPHGHEAQEPGTRHAKELHSHLTHLVEQHQVQEGSWIDHMLTTPTSHTSYSESPLGECVSLLSLAVTTSHAAGNLIAAFAEHHSQWRDLCDKPTDEAITAAIRESNRHDPVVQWSTRRATADARLGTTTIPRGSQLLLLYGSAARDTDAWGSDARRFDISRPALHDQASRQPVYGATPHPRAGNRFVETFLDALLRALLKKDALPSFAGPPRRVTSVILRGRRNLPLRLQNESRTRTPQLPAEGIHTPRPRGAQ